MLQDIIKTAFASSYTFYVKTQFYHWNVEGDKFYMYHELFGKIYEEVQGALDGFAEQIRTLETYAPGTLARIKELSSLEESEVIPSGIEMVRSLYADNRKVIADLLTAYKSAENEGELGISNFLQDRITAHEKHNWFLRASLV